MALFPGVFQLKGVVQHYAWGGYKFIPDLIGQDNDEEKPFAEYWLGAHPNHPSTLMPGDTPLSSFIDESPVEILGAQVQRSFGALPYLLKVLDVRQMLSIQVHPSKASAEKGYDDEDARGIDLKRPDRNYKDRNHKPELMVALSDFWLLHGFKSEKDLTAILNKVPELSALLPIWERGGYRGLYEYVMALPQPEVNTLLDPLVQRIMPQYEGGTIDRSCEDFWAARAVTSFCGNGQYDRGIFSIYFFNLLHLRKGEGIYQAAGLPHAYLEGQNVEIMANSDNVLRAGLTDKHVDVPELMKHVNFTATIPNIIHPQTRTHQVFESPAREFELHRYALAAGESATIRTATAEILVVLEGRAELWLGDERLSLRKGDAALALAGHDVQLSAQAPADVFRVTVPEE